MKCSNWVPTSCLAFSEDYIQLPAQSYFSGLYALILSAGRVKIPLFLSWMALCFGSVGFMALPEMGLMVCVNLSIGCLSHGLLRHRQNQMHLHAKRLHQMAQRTMGIEHELTRRALESEILTTTLGHWSESTHRHAIHHEAKMNYTLELLWRFHLTAVCADR
jgi:hypothetical protein